MSNERPISDVELEELFCEFVDDTTDDIEVVGMSFTPSRVLKKIDPIAFREGMLCFVNDKISNGEFRIGDDDRLWWV